MTIPRFFGCSRRADDHLDQTLNAWVAGEHELPASDLAADALDFHRWAEDARRTESAATGPAADTWNRVLRHTAQAESRGGDMSSVTIGTPERASAVRDERVWDRQSIHRYVNYAASLLIVFGVAFAGAFMVMQFSLPGGSNGPLAMVGQPDSATCDVEPLSQERVLEIVKNPIPFIANGPAGKPEYISVVLPTSAELYEAHDNLWPVAGNQIPTREDFESAEQFANEYLECLLFGTQGQVWNYYSPISIQKLILAEFPVFSSEADVTTRISERLQLPAIEGEWVWYDLPMLEHISRVSVNPDINLAILNDSQSMEFDQILRLGVDIRDVDGKSIVLTNGTGRNLIPNDPMITGTNDVMLSITLVRGRGSETWLVVPWPSLAEMGNPS